MLSIAHTRGKVGKLRGAVFRHFLQTPGRNVVLRYQRLDIPFHLQN